jgi:hypothetical protein
MSEIRLFTFTCKILRTKTRLSLLGRNEFLLH